MTRFVRALLVFATLAWVIAAALPASATPNTSITKVSECADSDCDSGSTVSQNSVVDGYIAIEASASASGLARLQWLEIQAQRDGTDSWVCLRHWDFSNGETSVSNMEYAWNTSRWPGDSGEAPGNCINDEPSNGKLTSNGVYDIRTVVRETGGVDTPTKTSSAFTVKVSNLPSAPEWGPDPRVLSVSEGGPGVELRWEKNPEPDMREYHYIRISDDGEYEYEVNASDPGQSGCRLDGSTYVCVDDYFPERGYGGGYSYILVALRSSPVSQASCRYGSGGCVESETTHEQSVTLNEPSPSPSPTPTNGGSGDRGDRTLTRRSGGTGGSSSSSSSSDVRGSRTTRTDNSEFFKGEYEESLPYTDERGFLPGAGVTSNTDDEDFLASDEDRVPLSDDARRVWMLLASGLVMVLSAAHLARFLRDH